MPSRPDPHSQRSRALVAGVSHRTIGRRDARAEPASAWIGARIHPPIEPDHPLSIERAERIRRQHGEAGAVWPVVGCNA